MRKSKAKESIIETAQKLIDEKGYSNLNVNEVAYQADVSIGTLYYHFPKGKMDILVEITSRKTAGYVRNFDIIAAEDNVFETKKDLKELLDWFFRKVIEIRRTDSQFLLALQTEMLANPDDYVKFVESYENSFGLQEGLSVLAEAMKHYPVAELGDLSGMQEKRSRIQRVVGLLISYQIMFPGYFGSDDEFVDMAIRIFFNILKDS